MDENLHDIDRLFRDSLEGHEELPPPNVWNAIDNNLDKTKVVAINKKYKELKKLAAALVVVLMGTVAWSIYHSVTLVKQNKMLRDANQNNGIVAKTPSDKNPDITERKGASDPGEKNSGKEIANPGVKAKENNNHSSNDILSAKNQPTFKSNSSTRNLLNATGKLPVPVKYSKREILNGTGLVATTAKSKNGMDIARGQQQKNENVLEGPALIKNDELSKAGEAGLKKPADEEDLYRSNSKQYEPLVTERMMIDASAGFYQGNLADNYNMSLAGSSIAIRPKKKSMAFSFMPFYAPQFNFNRLEDEHHDGRQPPDHDRDEIRRSEQQQHSYSFGVLAGLDLNKNWSVQTGISYMQKNTGIEPKTVFARKDDNGDVKYRFECSSGYGYFSPKNATMPAFGDSTRVGESENHLGYISIPLAINYHIRAGKFSMLPTVGTAINFLVKQNLQTEIMTGSSKTTETIKEVKGLKSSYFNGLVGLGFEYAFNEQFGINITPAANFGLEPINKNAAVKSYSNSFSVNAGLKWSF